MGSTDGFKKNEVNVYRIRLLEVEAIQWSGSQDLEKVENFIGADNCHICMFNLLVVKTNGNILPHCILPHCALPHSNIAERTDYIVKETNEKGVISLSVLNTKKFEKRYEITA